MTQRILTSTRRSAPPARQREYDAAWLRIQQIAATLDTRAWRFQAVNEPGLFLEFLEFAAGSDPRLEPALRDALRAMDAVFPPVSAAELWAENPPAATPA